MMAEFGDVSGAGMGPGVRSVIRVVFFPVLVMV